VHVALVKSADSILVYLGWDQKSGGSTIESGESARFLYFFARVTISWKELSRDRVPRGSFWIERLFGREQCLARLIRFGFIVGFGILFFHYSNTLPHNWPLTYRATSIPDTTIVNGRITPTILRCLDERQH
jgi:hypothetical protein